ncbi:hypothetical protein CANMA_003306 [Candida margitis]|uniref:uncharacterized protein n=1 Tax=Candida margitis TaxID=1775924 RepID=UPI00222615CC|nr:uncharacterized protein CANMA_003306 [Candida margitis]KAI5966060.1 hypothetical protein CANMA_003306 [Candida margitis]
MTNFVKDIEEIPNLKPPQETFVDDPTSLKDIHLDELTFDLMNGLKNVNNLHIFHVIYIYASFIKFMIKLQQNPQLYDKFRQQQLQKLEEREEAAMARLLNKNKASNGGQNGYASASCSVSPPISHSNSTSTTNSLGSSTGTLRTDEHSDKTGTAPPLVTTDHMDVDDGKTVVEDFADGNDLPADILLDRNDNDEVVFNDENIDNINFNYSSNKDNDEGDHSPAKYIPIDTLLENFKLDEVNSASSSEEELPSKSSNSSGRNTATTTTTAAISNFRTSLISEIEHSQKINHANQQLVKVFQLIKTPNLPIEQFLLRIKQYSPSISTTAYLHSIYILFKLTTLLGQVTLTTNNSFRFTVGAIRTCTKLLDDVYQKQQNFTHVVGVSLRDLSKIEVNFCYLINFNFNLKCLDLVLAQFLKVEFVELCQFMKVESNEVYNEVVNGF